MIFFVILGAAVVAILAGWVGGSGLANMRAIDPPAVLTAAWWDRRVEETPAGEDATGFSNMFDTFGMPFSWIWPGDFMDPRA